MRTNHGGGKWFSWSAVLAVAALGLTASSAAAQATVHLIAAPVTKTITLPNGNLVSVPMWGYALDVNNSGTIDGTESVTVPGPRLVVPVGSTSLTITLTNLLPPENATSPLNPTSIVIPGQPFAANPIPVAGRFRSMTHEVARGATADYTFTNLKPGTFLYQSGSHSAVQVQMGLYGALTKDAIAGIPASVGAPGVAAQAYSSVSYDHEVVLVYSEIDPALHEAVNAGTYGTPAGPTSTINYRPSLFLINGESYTNDAMAAIAAGTRGDTTILRMLNAGLRTHVPQLANGTLRIVAEDGNPLAYAKDQAEVMLAAGKTHDALWAPATDGVYSLYDRALGLNVPGQGTAGMLAKLSVGAAAGDATPTVVANNDSYSTTEGATLTVPDNGVLANDVGAVTAALTTSPYGGTVTLKSTGGFTYTPAPDFFGVDSFTYQAGNGGTASVPATVTIAVQAVPHAPVAIAQSIGVDQGGNVSVTLNATDSDGDALKYYLRSLPAHGALSYINPVTKIETPIVAGDLYPSATAKAIPAGLVVYTPSATPSPGYLGADSFNFVASDGALYSPAAAVSVSVFQVNSPATAGLTSPVTLAVVGPDGSPIASYRWTLEEDLTYKVVPGVPDPNTLAVSFHKSYMPVVASGDQSQMPKVNPSKRYFISVLPTENTYSNSGAEIEANQTAVTVTAAQLPLPTARIRVHVFQDNSPLDGVWSADELGLAGFQVTIDDAGGTYGMSGGHQSTDAFGNKIGTTYKACASPPCDGYQVARLGDGFVLTDTNGIATIENLVMGKYTVKVRAPGGQKWIQTSTIEGQPGIDAWVKPNEPQFFTEFGPPGPHVEVGFTQAVTGSGVLGQGRGPFSTISGRVTNLRMSRVPAVAQFSGAPFTHTRPWVALNSGATGGTLLYAQPTNADGTFSIAGVPTGSYQLMVFDSALDLIIGSVVVNVTAPAATTLGDVAVFNWFTNLYSYVFDDVNGDGIHQADEPGIPDQALNIRFRDGSIYQSLSTDDRGFKAFNETFPFFAWMIAEVDYTRFHSTGLTVVVDGGGDAGPSAPNYGWRDLPQINLPTDVKKDLPAEAINPQPQPDNGGAPFRTESGAGTPFLLLEGFQGFIGQSTLMMWGKAPYAPPGSIHEDIDVFPFADDQRPFPGPEDFDGDNNGVFDADHFNGGIAGIVHYGITRAENDPRWAVAENWDPGIADVRVQLWDASRTHLLNEGTSDNFNREGLEPTGCQWPNNAPFVYQGRRTDCFDGLRNFNQARPAAFDGGYAFSTILVDSYDPKHPEVMTFNNPISCEGRPAPCTPRQAIRPIPAGKYVVKVIVPPGYQLQKEEDKNVDFGDTYVPQQFWLTGYPLADGGATALTTLSAAVTPSATTIVVASGGGKSIHPNDQITIDVETMRVTGVVGDVVAVLRGQAGRVPAAHAAGAEVVDFGAQLAPTVSDNALIAPFCVGQLHQVPEEFSLFPGVPAPFGGELRPLCDAKLVTLRDGQQVAPDFHFFTEAPIAGHIYGMVLDDTTNEFDPNAPTFGEKYAPPFIGVAIRDWQGREITRTYTDQYGMYNALVPSTYTINPPEPSGVSPSILAACINPPTMPGPGGTVVPDPHFQKQYSHFCYPLQYLPGKTTYLDTPVVPTGGFTGNGTLPVDTEFPNHTPVIASVTGPEASAPGPYIVDRADDASRTIVITSAANMTVDGLTDVANPAFDGTGSQPKLIKRDYGFGTDGAVFLGDQPLTVTTWTNKSIEAIVPTGLRTGELSVVTGSGASARRSVLGLTLSVATPDMHGARPPKVVGAGESIQAAVDAAAPGDLILVTPGVHEEMVVMTKPVRLQGAGALSTTINVVTTPAENIQAWLDRMGNLLLTSPPAGTLRSYVLPNQPAMTPAPFQPGDVAAVVGDEGPGVMVMSRNQLSAGIGGTPAGNLATSQLGPLGTCLATGVVAPLADSTAQNFGSPSTDPASQEAYCLQNENYTATGSTAANAAWRPNARIDGFSLIGASNAPGVLVNGYARNLEISNNKIFTNSGTYAGGIQVGHPGAAAPFNDENAHNERVALHNNMVIQNASNETGGGGGIVVGTGADDYSVKSNFVAGNLSSGHGGGIAHLGRSSGGVIDSNTVIFNESFFQAIGTNGGGLFVGGSPAVAGASTPGSGNVDVSNNLVLGNGATGGDGGGVALQDFASTDQVRLYNNMIANNVAGLAGGGVSIAGVPAGGGGDPQFGVDVVHNTIVDNDSTGTAGGAFSAGPLTSVQQPAGISGRGVSVPRVRIANTIVWHNRTFYYGACTVASPCGTASHPIVPVGPGAVTQYGEKQDSAHPYWDLGTFGGGSFAPQFSMFSAAAETNAAGTTYGGSGNTAGTPPSFVASYFNTSRQAAYQVGETNGEATLISVPAALDEGGNFIRPQYGPLSLENPLSTPPDQRFGDYHVSAGVNGSALGALFGNDVNNVPNTLLFDFDHDTRPAGTPHRGADQSPGVIEPPTLTSISPNVGYRPATGAPANVVAVTLTGTNLAGAMAVNVSPSGVSVSNVVVNAAGTQITANFTISRTPNPIGNHNVSVTTPGGTSGSVTFTVTNPPPPTLTGIAPSTGVRPATGTASYVVALTGTNLTGATLTETSSNFSVSNVVVVNSTSITATIGVGSGASLGPKTLTVTTVGGTATIAFTVVPGTPVSFTGESGPGSLNGAGTTLSFGNQNGNVSDTVTLTIGGSAPVTFQTATVANGTGTAFSKGTDTCSGATRNPGETCTITVIFNGPAGNSSRTGTLSVPYTGAPGSPATLSLTGS